jgi:hypothetical protein
VTKITAEVVEAAGYQVGKGKLPAKEIAICCPEGRRVAKKIKPGALRKVRRQYPPEEGYWVEVVC